MASPPPKEQKNGAPGARILSSRMIPVEEMKRAALIDRSGNGTTLKKIPENANGNGATGLRKILENGNEDGVSSGTIKLSVDIENSFKLPEKSGNSGTRITKSVLLPLSDRVDVLPSDENFSWSKENYSKLQRTIDVWSFVLSLRAKLFLIDAKWSYVGGFSEEKKISRRRSIAVWVKETILQLGPTFIKLGQLFSTRSDLFPAEFVEELAKLQDRVPAFSPEKAELMIENELDTPMQVLFSEFERQPLAAASLGQVHRAVLRNGEQVVVKIQRPGLKELFDIDLSNLKFIAEYFQKDEMLGGPLRDWVGIYDECATVLYREIDYINEGRNADKFRRDFRNIKWVKVPKVYWDFTSRKVITLEYLPGIKINDLAALDAGSYKRSLIASRAIEAYLIQILKTGFFHADPHPGNLAVDVDGSLIYYDFGMMGEIKSFTKEKLLELFYAVYEEDASKVIQGLVDLGALVPTGDMGPVKKTIQFFLKNLTSQRPDQATTFTAIGEDLFAIAVDQPFRFPSTFTFVLRAFSTLEGIGYILDPKFSFAKIAAPYAQELLNIRDSRRDFVQELQRQAMETRDATVAMPMRVQHIEKFMQQLEDGDIKLRVRVLEAERAARKSSVLQTTTMNLVAAATLVNVGVTLSTQGLQDFAIASFLGAGAFSMFIFWGMKRVKSLDKFEDMIK
ncbi:protein ACTIVITY OF BC1 COMPLEX KINASE 7, chloroplastic [Selaginella moellendorffii]|uniref:protein ACTIVITY OF BC1 COMPLEX KINASE 7, chloroplastic n=1 Tax=Selaginella moellendorffii TaxID=88036 RepID=UPI000D1C8586|nr:protein ACTIVITY OF BC1 COMPLEX KINASE 7, chloroplastic [Selaginella moellendorffii]|eukprot:XP_024524239.1 protein ACTIVITY OF BC1 COMPLEX KINASE 7, chloroplastic [Selaginella moellendorffii]